MNSQQTTETVTLDMTGVELFSGERCPCEHHATCPDCKHEWDQDCGENYTNCPACGKRWSVHLDEIETDDFCDWVIWLRPEEEGIKPCEPLPSYQVLLASCGLSGEVKDGDTVTIISTMESSST